MPLREDHPRVRLGTTSIEVAPLGVGCWAWGDRFVWGYGRDYGEAEVRSAYDASRDSGLDFFDTAEIYGFGASERILGSQAADSTGIVIATKFFPYPWRIARGSLRRALQGSLQRLGRSSVDLYQIHWPSKIVPDRTWLEALADAVDEGLVGAVGVSNFSTRQMEEAHAVLARRGVSLATNQIEFSLLEREPERDGLLARARDLGVTVIAYSPLAMGLLTGKYTRESPPPISRRGRYASALPRLDRLVAGLRRIGDDHGGKTPGQVALNWTLAKGTLPIPGAKTRRQAVENAGALGWQLSAAEVERLDDLSPRA